MGERGHNRHGPKRRGLLGPFCGELGLYLIQCGLGRGLHPYHPEPQFLAHICCGQMASGIKMPLGVEVGRGPGHFVLDGDPAPLPKGGRAPFPSNFRPMFIVAKGMDGSRWHLAWRWALVHATYCARWGPSSPPKRAELPLNFRPIFIVAKRLDGSRCRLV